ncbi:DUF58 domain-containing protein [Methanothermococcus okinawensis]|nr:DUF58 domain-containing protein [Methanothermococcus okinawensis]
MNKTPYSKILSIFGIICYANGYLLNNLYSTFIGVFIFLYLYFTEKIVDFEIDTVVDKNNNRIVDLKEYMPTKLIFNIYKNNAKPYLKFKSKHGVISSNIFSEYSFNHFNNSPNYNNSNINNTDIATNTLNVSNSSNNTNLSNLQTYNHIIKYLVNVMPYKKGEFIVDAMGKIFDKRTLNYIDYSKSFKFDVAPSLEGLKHNIEQNEYVKSTFGGIVEPELDELKIYEIGDDIKRIDWKKSIGSNSIIVRKLLHMEAQSIYYFLDIGHSMRISIDENNNKINYATGVLLNFIKYNENDNYLFLYDDYKIVKSSAINNNNKRRIKKFSKNTTFQQYIEKELLNIKPILVDKYIPTITNIEHKRYNGSSFGSSGVEHNYKNQEYNDNNIIHSYLSRRKKGSSGIFECARYLMKMKTGNVMIFTDLDSNIIPLLKSINMLTKKGFNIIIYALYSPSFNIHKEELSNEEILQEIYKHYIHRQKIIKILRRKGIVVVDLNNKDGMKNIIDKLKRCKI